MSWKIIAAALTAVFAIILAQSVFIGPLFTIQNSLNETGDYNSDYLDGNHVITSLPSTWLDMGLIAIFGILTWGAWRIVRRELTRRPR